MRARHGFRTQLATSIHGLLQRKQRGVGSVLGSRLLIAITASLFVVTNLLGTAYASEPTDLAATPTATPSGDPFENNYNVASAPRLAWSVPYDLSLECPESRPAACRSGDHDFFLVPVKQGIPFVALTYDLGPGADTTLAIYRPAAGTTDPSTQIEGWQLVLGNDDALPETLRSQVLLTPTWSGDALLIVAASDRTDPPRLPAPSGPSGRYRLMVGSPFLPELQQVLQNIQPSPTPDAVGENAAAAASAEPPSATTLPTARVASDTEEIIRESCLTGTAKVVNTAGAHFSAAAVPASNARMLMVYPKDTLVALLGSCYLGWVKVRPANAVSPGWMYAPDLALVEQAESAPDPTTGSSDAAIVAQPTSLIPPANAQPTARPVVVVPLPTQAIAQPTALPRQALTVAVQILNAHDAPQPGLRVQLIDVFGAVLREGSTDEHGQISLVADLSASAAVWVQVPALGLTVPVDRAKPTVAIVVPG